MADTLIICEAVSKKFSRSLKKSLWYGLKDLGNELIGREFGGRGHLRQGEFWAVNKVGFSVERGQCIGLLGRNGAGKTTLLRMLNGLIRPDQGRIEMRGAVGAMIALGAGMKGVLTGRENAYSMAALRGMSKAEADRKIDEIVDFAEIEESIDAPMQNYSSGMKVRLNFAIASALDPDVLLLDEVLAVGDAAFRDKCYHRIAELRRDCAVIFVSHNMDQISRTSTHSLVLDHGAPVFSGSIEDGIRAYEEINSSAAMGQASSEAFLSIYPPISAFEATLERDHLQCGEPLEVRLAITCETAIENFAVKVLFYNSSGACSADGCVFSKDAGISLSPGENLLQVQVASVPLKNGVYKVAFNLMDSIGALIVWSFKNHTIRTEGAYVGAIADCQLKLKTTNIDASSS